MVCAYFAQTIQRRGEVIRATPEEKEYQIEMLKNLHETQSDKYTELKDKLVHAATHNENVFEVLMEATKYLSLGPITHILFEVGGQYRRNM